MNRIPEKTARWIGVAAIAFLSVALLGGAQAQGAAVDPATDEGSINAARGAFERFLDSHPEIAQAVQFNPRLLSDDDYLGRQPELKAFLETHPLVNADPRAFVRVVAFEQSDPLDDIIPFAIFLCILVSLLWVARSLLENRRWSRSASVQADLHTKLLDRFGSSQEMLTYLQTDAGRRFLEYGAVALEAGETRRTPPVIGRILWSIQAGIVLLLVGIGLMVVRTSLPHGAEPLLVLGTLGLSLGAGFALSAALSYLLSRRLGLLPPASAPSPTGRG